MDLLHTSVKCFGIRSGRCDKHFLHGHVFGLGDVSAATVDTKLTHKTTESERKTFEGTHNLRQGTHYYYHHYYYDYYYYDCYYCYYRCYYY